MALLAIEDLYLQYGSKRLFEGAALAIEKGDRLGLVGPNGTGKSSLLKVMAGQLEPDGGRVTTGRDIQIGYLAQEHSDPGSGQLLEYVLASVPRKEDIESKIDVTQSEISTSTDENIQMELAQVLSDLHTELAQIESQFAPHRAKSILAGLGFKDDEHDKPLGDFSGGWRMRAALAALLFQGPDVLLLDEPTNHLDMPTVAWLNTFLETFPKAVVLTCHDREFLNRHVTKVASLELEGLKLFRGNYDEYIEQRKIELEYLEARMRTGERKKKELEAFVTRFRAKATKARQAQSKAKMLEKLEEEQIDLPQIRRAVSIRFAPVERCGVVALGVDDISFSYPGLQIFSGLNLEVRRGDRIAVVGVNGAGKTTLLKLICGELQPQVGEIKMGHKVTPSYFAQHQAEVLDSGRSVLDEIAACSPSVTTAKARTLCGAFLFSGDDVEKSIGVLSGGEKTRVALARMLADPGNLLLLDEPTNHLDTESADKLTESLLGYDGTILFISHNLDFARRLSNKVWNVADGQVEVYPGSLGDYLDYLSAEAQDGDGQDPSKSTKPRPKLSKSEQKRARAEERKARAEHGKKLSKLERKVAQLEVEIAALEKLQASQEKELEVPTEDYDEMTRLGALYENTKLKLENKLSTWTEAQDELSVLSKK